MPYTLKQLEDRRNSCIKKIQELKETAKDKGAVELEVSLSTLKYLNVQDKRQMKKKEEEDLKNKLQI